MQSEPSLSGMTQLGFSKHSSVHSMSSDLADLLGNLGVRRCTTPPNPLRP